MFPTASGQQMWCQLSCSCPGREPRARFQTAEPARGWRAPGGREPGWVQCKPQAAAGQYCHSRAPTMCRCRVGDLQTWCWFLTQSAPPPMRPLGPWWTTAPQVAGRGAPRPQSRLCPPSPPAYPALRSHPGVRRSGHGPGLCDSLKTAAEVVLGTAGHRQLPRRPRHGCSFSRERESSDPGRQAEHAGRGFQWRLRG